MLACLLPAIFTKSNSLPFVADLAAILPRLVYHRFDLFGERPLSASLARSTEIAKAIHFRMKMTVKTGRNDQHEREAVLNIYISYPRIPTEDPDTWRYIAKRY